MGRGLQRKLLRPPPWGEGLHARLPEPRAAAHTPGLPGEVRTGLDSAVLRCLASSLAKLSPQDGKPPRPDVCMPANGTRETGGVRQTDPERSARGWAPRPRKHAARLRLRSAARGFCPGERHGLRGLTGVPGNWCRPAPGTCGLTHGEALGTGRLLRQRLPERGTVMRTPGHQRIDRRHLPAARSCAIPGPRAASGTFTDA